MPRKCGLCRKTGHNKSNCPNAHYKGEYNYKGEKHGKGTYEYKIKKYKNTRLEGAKYEGDWVNGKREGTGKMIYGNLTDPDFGGNRGTKYSGSKYVGEWKNDEKQGKGIITYANGDKYNGDWVNDNEHGNGIRTNKDGSQFEGEWNRGHGFKGKIILSKWMTLEKNYEYSFDTHSNGWNLLCPDSLNNHIYQN